MRPPDPKCHWMHQPNGPCMHDGTNPSTGKSQSFYFPDDHPQYPGWFKGMEQIIHKCKLWPKGGLLVECTGPKHPEGPANCCCRHLLFLQPDFISQKPMLQEHIELCGHLCDFYPKYHCELNFIEQYWGAAKLRFRVAGRHTSPLSFPNLNSFSGSQTGWPFHFSLSSRTVWCPGCLGQQKVPWPSHASP